jgi:hypothetical protein
MVSDSNTSQEIKLRVKMYRNEIKRKGLLRNFIHKGVMGMTGKSLETLHNELPHYASLV